MLGYQEIKGLVLEVLRTRRFSQFAEIAEVANALAQKRGLLGPPKKPGQPTISIDGRSAEYWQLEDMVREIAWDLIIDRVLTVGIDHNNYSWPFLRLTDFGKEVVSATQPTHYDPKGYISALELQAPGLDEVIKQYVGEGLNCFRQRLFFAAAVMFGAAAEKAVLLLLKAIGDAETDPNKKRQALDLLEPPRLPSIFSFIEKRIQSLIKAKPPQPHIPYTVHEGCTQHLLSLFEMIRVHRNQAVHPEAGKCSREKVFMTIQSFPGALEVVYRLIKWFSNNTI